MRSTMSGFFLVGSVMSIVALAATGAVNGHTMVMFAILIPAAVVGYVLSRGLNRVLDPKRLRWLAIGVSGGGRRRADRPRTTGDRRLTCPKPDPMSPTRRLRPLVVRKVKSAVRTVELLEFLAARHDEPARLREISHALDMPRSSAHALLRTLVAQGWVRTDATGTLYAIGVRALLVGTSYLDSDPYLPLITPFLDDLRADLDETFHVGRLDGTDIVYLATRESKQYTRTSNRVGRRLPAYATALGKSLLAERFGTERDAYVPAALKPLTDKTIVDRAVLDAAPRRRPHPRLRHRRRGEHHRAAVLRRGPALLPARPGRHQRVGTPRPADPATRTRDRRRAAHHGRQGVSRGAAPGQRRQMVRDPSIRRLRMSTPVSHATSR